MTKKPLINLLKIILFCFIVSCGGYKIDCPSDISNECFEAMESAKKCLEFLGYDDLKNHSIKVVKHVGSKQFSNGWCWFDNDWNWNQYVCGLYHHTDILLLKDKHLIEIGASPYDGSINIKTLRHEFGHFWLCSNDYSCDDQDENFKKCF